MTHETNNRRVLIVDDNERIHRDFAKILAPPRSAAASELERLHAQLFEAAEGASPPMFELAYAFQGQEALAHVTNAPEPFAVAFIDMRMPPGWDGLQTITRLWEVDPDIQIVICSAFSDYSWEDLRRTLGDRDSLLVIKKPFDPIEVVQSAHALATKWTLSRRVRSHVAQLERAVRERTEELARNNELLQLQIRERERIEHELRLAHKLEALGQLAAGVAHEISTPIQYVGHMVEFLRDNLDGVFAVARDSRPAAAEDDEVAFLCQEIPTALDAIEQGLERVTKVVRGIREISHPGGRDPVPADINRALISALEVSSNAYSLVADLETDLGELPPVVCYVGDLMQVFLNLVINAAHAMDAAGKGRGVLRVASYVDGVSVIVAITDTGGGIPEAIHPMIFDAFFTTKALGKGTGQGLAISRQIVAERHGGELTFDTVVGVGTTFYVRLPINGRGPMRPRSATAIAGKSADSRR